MGDFKAFYCAGNVVLHGHDPYAAGPLGACEALKTYSWMASGTQGATLPAPLPGYEIAFFVPFALLSYSQAVLVWSIISLAALVFSIILFARCGVGPWPVILVAFSLMVAGISIAVGELPPLALAGLAIAAAGVQSKRVWMAVIGLTLTMAEPQIGLLVGVALAALSRRYLWSVAGTFVALVIISLLTLGFSENVEYAVTVLPAHILAELPSVLQYGGSWVVQRLGAPDTIAVLVGRITYGIAIVGTFLFARTARARENPVLPVLAAAVFAVVSGPFVHLDHIALAIPAALWLTSVANPLRNWQIAAAVALTIPPLYIFAHPLLYIFVPLITVWIIIGFGGSSIVAIRGALVSSLVILAIGFVVVHTGTGNVVVSSAQHQSTLAQDSWGTWVRHRFVMLSWSIFLVKAPTWFGMLMTAGTAICGRLCARVS